MTRKSLGLVASVGLITLRGISSNDRVLRVLIVTGDVPPPTRRFLRFVVRRILFQHIDKMTT